MFPITREGHLKPEERQMHLRELKEVLRGSYIYEIHSPSSDTGVGKRLFKKGLYNEISSYPSQNGYNEKDFKRS